MRPSTRTWSGVGVRVRVGVRVGARGRVLVPPEGETAEHEGEEEEEDRVEDRVKDGLGRGDE